MRLHPSITEDRVLDAVNRGMLGLDNPGFCIECGEEQDDCEPDARQIECHACTAFAVYGAEEIMMESTA